MEDSKKQVYQKQSKIFSDTSIEQIKLAESWFDETTADYWLHNRMYEAVDCISDATSSSWLTIGDGRWGLDSIRLKNRGIKKIIPTDICETLLIVSKERGLIENYSIENAEHLSFDDNSFDYVLCKESYHHFPRPYIALYEMLRVAKKAVLLAEPNDEPLANSIKTRDWLFFKFGILLNKLHINGRPKHYRKPVLFGDNIYEESGNFVYTISKREMQKLMLGLNYPLIVYKEINSFYIEGCEFEPADISKSQIFKKITNTIKEKDEKCSKGWAAYDKILLALYKERIDDKSRFTFEKHGFTLVDLPRNPHL